MILNFRLPNVFSCNLQKNHFKNDENVYKLMNNLLADNAIENKKLKIISVNKLFILRK